MGIRGKGARRVIAAVVAYAAACTGVAVALAPSGEVGPTLGITANGHALHPIGRMTTVGDFPTGSALTRDGRELWVADCGHGKNNINVVSVASGEVVQVLPLPGCYGGVAMTPDGRRAFVGGTPINSGTPTVDGPTKGNQGDVIHVFDVAGNGLGSERDPIQLTATSGGSGRDNSLPPVSGTGSAYPEGLAVSPDGAHLVVALNQADKAVLIDLRSGSQTAVSTGRYPDGVVFDRHGVAYVSNEYDGTLTVIDVAAARATGTIAGLGGSAGDQNSHPDGMAADPSRDRIYVAVTNRDMIGIVDTARGRVTGLVSVGRPPAPGTAPTKLAIAPDGQTLYAADSGEDAVAAVSLTPRPRPSAAVLPRRVVRVPDVRAIADYWRGLRLAARRHQGHRLTTLRRHPPRGQATSACQGPTPRQAATYVRRVLRALTLRGRRRSRRLAAARRALPVIRACTASPGYLPGLPANTVIGRLPTAAYPDDVQVTPDGSQLLWVAGKGLGAGPNPQYSFDGDKRPGVTPNNVYGTYVLDMLAGRVGDVPIPSDRQIRAATPLADAQSQPYNTQNRPAGNPIPAPGTGPSAQIKHVFYIVRENRTYDQVFGSDRRGDGDPALELFDDNGVPGTLGGVTPNAHKLARAFPLLDHFYADSEVSVDGHIITSSGYATDYVQKATAANYSRPGRAFDMGIYPVTFPPNDFVFDQAVRQGISFRDYGEAVSGGSPMGNDGRPTFSGVVSNTDAAYANNVFIGCLAPGGSVGNLAACVQDSGIFDGTGKPISSKSRFNEWLAQFQQQLASDSVPTLSYMILPNDHTNGTTPGDYSPQALIADNDLALGQIVDAISHSAIWGQTAIVVVEDDSQDGADHVDAHRMPAFVISPWAKRGAVVHTRYDQYSALHTVELLCGIDPLSLNDAEATPMYDAFDSTADVPGTRYTAVAPTQDIGQVNGSGAPLAAMSARLPWKRIDEVPQELSDQTLWASVHGAASKPPPPGPNASPLERERAAMTRAVLAAGGDTRALLSRHGAG